MTQITVPTYESIAADMLTRVAPQRFKQLESIDAPFYSALEKKKRTGTSVQKRIKNGQNRTFKFIPDAGDLSDGVATGIEAYTLFGKFIHGKLEVPRGAATQAAGNPKETANLLLENLDDAMVTATQVMNQALIIGGGVLDTLTSTQGDAIKLATGTADSAEITTDAASEIKVGQALDIYQGSTLVMTVFVTSRTPNFFSNTHTLTVKDTLAVAKAGWTPANGDTLHLHGAYDNAVTGVIDVCGAGNLYGVAVTTPGWSGTIEDIAGPCTASNIRTMRTQAKNRAGNSGKVDALLMNANRKQQILETEEAARYQFTGPEIKINDYSVVDKISGIKVIEDEACPDATVIGLNMGDIRYAEFKELFQEGEGKPGQNKPMNFVPHPDRFVYFAELWGMGQLEVDRRSSFVQLTGCTD